MRTSARRAQCSSVSHAHNGFMCVWQVPWDDLRYIFGEIMYGGHIVEDWDRRLANAYLFKYFNETLLEGMEMFPAFFTPANTMTHKQVRAVGNSRRHDGVKLCLVYCSRAVSLELRICSSEHAFYRKLLDI